MTTSSRSEIPLRITVRWPPPEVEFAIQRGRDQLLEATTRSTGAIVFDFLVGVSVASPAKPAALRGPYVQGPSGARFIYLNSGTRAAQRGSAWNRRAKLPLAGISARMIAGALRSATARLDAEVDGTASDGGPVYATIKSVDWRLTGASAK